MKHSDQMQVALEITDIVYYIVATYLGKPFIDIQKLIVGQPLLKVFIGQSANSDYLPVIDENLIVTIVGVAHSAVMTFPTRPPTFPWPVTLPVE